MPNHKVQPATRAIALQQTADTFCALQADLFSRIVQPTPVRAQIWFGRLYLVDKQTEGRQVEESTRAMNMA